MIGVEVIITPEFAASIIRQAKPIIENKLNIFRSELIDEFKSPKSGRVYRRPTGGQYQASAPGEPPAIRTGHLLDSISQPQLIESAGSVVGQVVIAAPYAGDLERGTGRIAPRPFVRPAIDSLIKGLNRLGGR